MSATKKDKKPTVDESSAEPTGKFKGKDYQQELRRLHVELVKLQQWVVHKGLKVCIVFEGLKHIPHEELAREKIKLPERQKPRGYQEPDYPFKLVPELTWPPG